MTVPPRRKPAQTREQLRRWIEQRWEASEVEISNVGGPAATGYSHETVLFDARWTSGAGAAEASLVARVEPAGYTVFPDGDLESEHRLVRTLAGHTGVPLPRIRDYEPDAGWLGAPFYVMDALPGRVPGDNPPYTFGGWLLESPPEAQARVWWSGLEALVLVHASDVGALDLGFLAATPRGELAWWERYLAWMEVEAPSDLLHGLQWLRANEPAPSGAVLCWGDARIGNQIFDGERCVGVLDWEMASIGPPELDLGWFLYFDRMFSDALGMPRPPGFPSHEAAVARYEDLTGHTVANLDWYVIFAGFRFSAILLRLQHLMELYGQAEPGSGFGTESFALQFLVKQLGEA